MARSRPSIRDDLTIVQIDGEVLIYDEDDGSLHHLNATAGVVLGLCDGTRSAPDIASEIADAFELGARSVERQVRSVLRSFAEAGILRTATAAPSGRA